jgi:hypothetical protein
MKVRRVVSHPMYNMGVAHDNDVALFQVCMSRNESYIMCMASSTLILICRPEDCIFVIVFEQVTILF